MTGNERYPEKKEKYQKDSGTEANLGLKSYAYVCLFGENERKIIFPRQYGKNCLEVHQF